MQQITFIIPNRNNWQYLNLCCNSIKKFAPNHFTLILDDCSNLDTIEAKTFLETYANEKNFSIEFFKPTPKKENFGHTILYNVGFNLAKTDICCILHADMVITSNFVENLLKYLVPKTIVSATRIEPPLHPAGVEKIIQNFGIYPQEFNEAELNEFSVNMQKHTLDKTTNGFFAPWCMFKDDYFQLGGMDELFAPYPHEDVDFANRAFLNEFKLIQSWGSLVYHFTCRGHRWTEEVNKNHELFDFYEKRAMKNFIRKWGFVPILDNHSFPKMITKYNIGLILKHSSLQHLILLEPFFDEIYTDIDFSKLIDFIDNERKNTSFDIAKKFKKIDEQKNNEIVVFLNDNKIPQGIENLILEFKVYLSENFDQLEIGPLFSFKDYIIFYKNIELKKDSSSYSKQFFPKKLMTKNL